MSEKIGSVIGMSDLYKRMKANPGDKLVKMCCDNCEFNFGVVGAGYGTRTDNGKETYGMSMDEAIKMFPDGCDDFGISLDAFIEQEKLNGR